MRPLTRYLIQITIGLALILCVAYGRTVSQADNVMELYGFPFVWGSHQTVSLAGPMDDWSLNIWNLWADLGFWVLVLIVSPSIIGRFSFVSCDTCERSRLSGIRSRE